MNSTSHLPKHIQLIKRNIWLTNLARSNPHSLRNKLPSNYLLVFPRIESCFWALWRTHDWSQWHQPQAMVLDSQSDQAVLFLGCELPSRLQSIRNGLILKNLFTPLLLQTFEQFKPRLWWIQMQSWSIHRSDCLSIWAKEIQTLPWCRERYYNPGDRCRRWRGYHQSFLFCHLASRIQLQLVLI